MDYLQLPIFRQWLGLRLFGDRIRLSPMVIEVHCARPRDDQSAYGDQTSRTPHSHAGEKCQRVQ